MLVQEVASPVLHHIEPERLRLEVIFYQIYYTPNQTYKYMTANLGVADMQLIYSHSCIYRNMIKLHNVYIYVHVHVYIK